MADRHLDDVFGIRPVPKRNKRESVARLRNIHSCAADRICIYVIGDANASASKVGVSRTPYQRLATLSTWAGSEMWMCYFAEVSRSEGFAIEREYHRAREARGEKITGEWVSAPRDGIARELRAIMAARGITPSHEVGDTGESECGSQASRGWVSEGGWDVPINAVNCRNRR